MEELLQPLKADSLKDVFVERFEELILSGKISIGQKLPSERELAVQLGVSRPVVHEGLVELETRGLVTMKPRVGTVVNDYRREGSLTLLNSLVNYHQGKLEEHFFDSILDMRNLFELETARLAALNRDDTHLREFEEILEKEKNVPRSDIDAIVELDFRVHHLVALASGNVIYSLLINSFREVYTNLTTEFFGDQTMTELVFSYHFELFKAIRDSEPENAVGVMKKIIDHGEEHLREMYLEGEK